jgi:hypothetical protein
VRRVISPECNAPADGELPMTYLFKTKDGGQGVIQFTQIDRGPERPRLTVKWKTAKQM